MIIGKDVRLGEQLLDDGVVAQGDILDADALSTSIRALWKSSAFPTRTVAVGLANRDVVTRQLDITDVGDRDIRSALRFELTDMIPFPPSDAILDFARVETFQNDHDVTEARILAVAAHREGVGNIIDVVRAAGLRPVRADATAFGLVRSASLLGLEAGTRALVHIGDSSMTVVVHDDGIVRFTRRVTIQGGGIEEAADLEADLVFDEQYRQRAQGTATSATAVTTRSDPLVAAIAGTIEYYSIQPGAVGLKGLDFIGDLDRAAAVEPAVHDVLGAMLQAPTPTAFDEVSGSELEAAARGRYSAVLGLVLAPGPGVAGPQPMMLLPVAPGASPRKVAFRAAGISILSAVLGVGAISSVGPDVDGAVEEADAAEATTAAIDVKLLALSTARQDSLGLRQGTARVESVAKKRVPWEVLVAAIRRSTPFDTTLLSITTRAAATSPSGTTPGAIELTAQAPTQASASAWLVELAKIPGLKDPWLSSAGTADEDGVAGVSTFAITAQLEADLDTARGGQS